MNKYFKLLTTSVLAVIAGVGVAMINPVTAGILVATAGVIYAGVKFLSEK